MEILFLGQYYPEPLISKFIKNSKIGLDFAAHNLHKALFEGFKLNNQNIYTLNAPILGSFPPFYKKMMIPSYKNESARLNSISYVNISYLKRLSIKRKMRKEIIRWCSQIKGEKILFFYNFTLLSLLPEIKHKFPDVKACLLVTDLPQYMNTYDSIYSKVNRFISPRSHINYSYNEFIDGYIVLATGMVQKLQIGNKPWLLMEGIYNSEISMSDVSKDTNRTIMYTGNLAARYGIQNLLKAFSLIENPNYRLWIRGNGELAEEIKKISQQDSRVQYYPPMSKLDLIKLQKRATLLINPVLPTEEFTKYFFPSKTLEYLASGTPTLMYDLDCVPSDYQNHIFFVKDYTPQHLANKIIEICEKPQKDLDDFGRSAANFISKNKSPKPQVEKIIKFLQKI